MMIDLDHISDASFTDLMSLGKDDTTGTHAATNAAEAMVATAPEYKEINEGINHPACSAGGNFAEPQKLHSPKTYFVIVARGGSTMNVQLQLENFLKIICIIFKLTASHLVHLILQLGCAAFARDVRRTKPIIIRYGTAKTLNVTFF